MLTYEQRLRALRLKNEISEARSLMQRLVDAESWEAAYACRDLLREAERELRWAIMPPDRALREQQKIAEDRQKAEFLAAVKRGEKPTPPPCLRRGGLETGALMIGGRKRGRGRTIAAETGSIEL